MPKSPRPSEIRARFAGLGFGELTDIQEKALPLILGRKNALVIAPTGSGKTESSVIPVFACIAGSRSPGRIRALYVTPLRALNRDVFRRISRYAQAEGLTMAIRHGDTPQSERRRIAKDPPDVLVTTPETLVILLTQKKYLEALSGIEWVIIDEVHELLPSERGAQLSLSLERLQRSCGGFARVGLSATVGSPLDAARFVAGTDRDCSIAQDSSVREYDVQIRYVDGTVTDAADAIAEHVSGMQAGSPVLLFANTRGEAEFLAATLRERSSIPVDLHHGSLSREVREEAEESLRGGRGGIVVCTSSLELGLDIGSVDLVIHYGSPRQVSKLVQRIGRSRHSRGTSARGLIVTNSADDELEARAILDRIRLGQIEEQRIHSGSLDVLAHHLVGMALQLGRVAAADALAVSRGAFAFAGVTAGDVWSVLEQLHGSGLVRLDRKKAEYGMGGRSIRYHFENLSTIPDILKFKVFDSVGKRAIGSLDQRFVGDHGEQGSVFVLRGSHWRIMSVDEKALTVNVEPAGGAATNVPYWEGESIPVELATAQTVGRFRSRVASGGMEVSGRSLRGLQLAAVPDERTVVAESARAGGTLVLHCCFGTRINAALAALATSMLSSVLGYQVDGRSDAYRIALSSRGRIPEGRLFEILRDEYDLEDVISASLSGTHNVNWRTWCVAKKFGMVARGAVYERSQARFLYERNIGGPVASEALRELFHDKYDIAGAAEVLEGIRAGRISLVWSDAEKFSQLAEPILDHAARYYSSPSSVDKGIMDMVRARLRKTRHRLVCARCGRWERTAEAGGVDFALVCPRCRARQITATYHSDYELARIIRKKSAGKRLVPEEERRFARAWKAASLVESFGKTALLVLSGYGVGADTAARILRNMVDEEGLYRQIYEAERQYVMTRGFWD